MHVQIGNHWPRIAAGLVLLLGVSLGIAPSAQAQEHVARDQRVRARLEPLMPSYQASGPLGFRLIDTPVEERVARQISGSGQRLLWSAWFTSRWALTDDQLDRWSAQAVGLLLDGVAERAGTVDPSAAAAVQLASWERLDVPDIGDRRIAYRYTLATAGGERAGEASLVVFARGSEVGITGAGTIGLDSSVDALALARALDTGLVGATLAARSS